jgi:hypothetical protein
VPSRLRETNAAPFPFTLTVPKLSNRLRLGALGYGVILFVWSSLEDNSVLPAVLLGSGLALILGVLWVTARLGSKTFAARSALLFAALVGAATGLGSGLAVALLMLIKNGLHAHLFPDYPFGLIVDILARAPLWALAGIFAGIGLLLGWWALKKKS